MFRTLVFLRTVCSAHASLSLKLACVLARSGSLFSQRRIPADIRGVCGDRFSLQLLVMDRQCKNSTPLLLSTDRLLIPYYSIVKLDPS